jgi:hypothetical protein
MLTAVVSLYSAAGMVTAVRFPAAMSRGMGQQPYSIRTHRYGRSTAATPPLAQAHLPSGPSSATPTLMTRTDRCRILHVGPIESLPMRMRGF